ncbi:MAG: hypothetical protein DRP62_07835 [Planctomycetota bacterium]|nr:MAG: hypothetical protein DRP62_07835 [Planctomycetota bacterium]
MKPADNIEDSIRKLRLTTTAATDKRILNNALAALGKHPQTGPATKLKTQNLKLKTIAVAAAVIIIAALIVVKVFTGPAEKQGEVITKSREIGMPVAEEIQNANQKAFADANSKFKIQNRKSVIDTEAIAKIKTRLEKQKQEAPITKQPPKLIAEPNEKDRQQYIYGWLVDANDNPVSGEIQLGGTKVKTAEDGAFTIREPEYKEFGSVFGSAFDANGILGCFFIWNKNNDTNDAEIVVKPLASVSGFVVDNNANPVDDFKLKISVFVKDDLAYRGSIGEEPWKAAAYSDGSFDINSIPTGVPLQLAVKRPGFKTSIKLDNLTPGRNLELGEITLEPLPGFSEDTQWNCSLSGFVVDENNEPLFGAKVSAAVAEERFETATDTNGWYELEGLPNDVQMEMASYFDGYGHNLFACTCFDTNSRLDIQLFPPAYDWYDKPAPGLFVQKWLNTEPITLEELKGRVVLLYIGVDSAKDAQFVQELGNIYENYGQALFTAIAIHKRLNRGSTEKRLMEFIRQHNIKFPFGIDEKADVVEDMMPTQERPRQDDRITVSRRPLRAEGAMYSLYEVKAHPAYYLIDKSGILRTSPTRTNLREWIEHLLAE